MPTMPYKEVDKLTMQHAISDLSILIWANLRDQRLSLDSERWVEYLEGKLTRLVEDYAKQAVDAERRASEATAELKKLKKGTSEKKG